ncbi:hypothetical protein [Oceanobacillus sojae]|uniref:hypothetical protein n=1 Tax=Oceanobacillus sojae TaxID=582851 RepID=UPI00362F24F3
MEKIQLTQDQERALKEAWQEKGKAGLINYHSLTEYDNNWASLGQLSTDDIARALYIGYEVIPQFKVGDWVIFEYKAVRVIGEILEIETDEFFTAKVDDPKYQVPQNIALSKLRHVIPEEIQQEKKRRFWEKLGREVDEYRQGDIVTTGFGNYTSITKLEMNKKSVYFDGPEAERSFDEIYLVAPEEQRLDK